MHRRPKRRDLGASLAASSGAALALIASAWAAPAAAGLAGATVRMEAIIQETPADPVTRIGVLTEALVSDEIVEFPSLAALETGAKGYRLVDVSIDVKDESIDIDFDRVVGGFAPGVINGYVFIFEGARGVEIRAARIDRTVTTVPLEDKDVWFDGARLYVNVENLSYRPSSFIRIVFDGDLFVSGFLDD